MLTPIRIFEGSFSGATVFENAGSSRSLHPSSFTGFSLNVPSFWVSIHLEFVTPAAIRAANNRELGAKYRDRKEAQQDAESRREGRRLDEDELAVTKVFA